ncbi:hypothetical protein PR048_025364 [Dryococelus australis]|uniref:Uncharacterized protein n=1 Tax=Dryococelus australis TaxID=614101 RepID=A0ABQ9GR44_9NEOP|nr:hypothetical protein PR048_025364 [Dryococelus australis]
MLTTIHNAQMVTVQKRAFQKMKLIAVVEYNKMKGGKSGGQKKNALDFRITTIEKMISKHNKEEFSPKDLCHTSSFTNRVHLIGRNFQSLNPASPKK